MFYVEVKRTHPYVESLGYEFDNLDDAREYAQAVYNLLGVEDVIITNEKEEKTLSIWNS